MKKMIFIGICIVLLPIAFVFCHSESYCFFYPGIDTRYASGYSESAFD